MSDAQAHFEVQWAKLMAHYQNPSVQPRPEGWDTFEEAVVEASQTDPGYLDRVLAQVTTAPTDPQNPATFGTWRLVEVLLSRTTALLGATALPQHPVAWGTGWKQVPEAERSSVRQAWAKFWSRDLYHQAQATWQALNAQRDPHKPLDGPFPDALEATLIRLGTHRFRLVAQGIPGCEPAHLGAWAEVLIEGLRGSGRPDTDHDARYLAELIRWVPAHQWDRWRQEGQADRWSARWHAGSALPAVWQAHERALALGQRPAPTLGRPRRRA